MSGDAAARDLSQLSHSRQTPLAVLAVVALAIAARLPAIDRPLVGPFATKNAVYAMIARNWAEGRASLWYPTLDCLVGGKRSLHMLEWPASAYASGALWHVFGGRLDLWGRATAVGFSAASVALLFLLVRRWHGPTAALGAALALALSPMSILYGRAFMLEASLVFFTLATFYALDRWLDRDGAGWLALASSAFVLLLLTKIYMLVLLLPLGMTIAFSRSREKDAAQRQGGGSQDAIADRSQTGAALSRHSTPASGRGEPKRWFALAALMLSIVPAAVWYWHALRTADPANPLAANVFYSVRDSAAAHSPPSPLLANADFYRQMLDDLTGVVLTPIGFALLLVALVDPRWRRHAAWAASAAILVAALPRKFYEMNYYWLAVLPLLTVMVGLGWETVRRGLRLSRRAAAGLLLLAVIFSARYTVGPLLATLPEDRGVVGAAAAVRELTEPEEPVVTMHGSTLDLLYYCDRPGWAIEPNSPDLEARLDECRDRGARYLVIVGRPNVRGRVAIPAAADQQPEVAHGDGYVVLSLQP